MATIYCLNHPEIPETAQISKWLEDTGHVIRNMASRAELQEALREERKAVVFFSPPHNTPLNSWTGWIQSALPAAACVAVLSEEAAAQEHEFPMDCDLLLPPFTRANVQSRLSNALRLTDLSQRLEITAQRDEVTLLFNHRYFHQRLSDEMSLSKRHLTPLACVILGINFYPVYLDSYGYDFITRLIQHVGQILQSHIRQEDIVARIRDDEIALLLPRSTEKGAKILTQRILDNLNDVVFEYGEVREQISVQAGIAGFPQEDNEPEDADSVIRYARHALHNARSSDEERDIQLFSAIRPAL